MDAGAAGAQVAVFVQLEPGQEADELLAVDVLPVGLGGEQVGPIDLTGGHLGEELLDQWVDAPGADDQAHRANGPIKQQRAGASEQQFGAEITGE